MVILKKFRKVITPMIIIFVIISISGCSKDKITEVKNKTNVIFNIINKELILEESTKKIGFKDKFDGFRILTVGRLSGEKRTSINYTNFG